MTEKNASNGKYIRENFTRWSTADLDHCIEVLDQAVQGKLIDCPVPIDRSLLRLGNDAAFKRQLQRGQNTLPITITYWTAYIRRPRGRRGLPVDSTQTPVTIYTDISEMHYSRHTHFAPPFYVNLPVDRGRGRGKLSLLSPADVDARRGALEALASRSLDASYLPTIGVVQFMFLAAQRMGVRLCPPHMGQYTTADLPLLYAYMRQIVETQNLTVRLLKNCGTRAKKNPPDVVLQNVLHLIQRGQAAHCLKHTKSVLRAKACEYQAYWQRVIAQLARAQKKGIDITGMVPLTPAELLRQIAADMEKGGR